MNETFMREVEEHERSWGNKSYQGRPSLLEIIQSPVVVFWEHVEQDVPNTVMLYNDLKEIEKYYVRILATRNPDGFKRRIVQVFQNQERVVIKGVKIAFGPPED